MPAVRRHTGQARESEHESWLQCKRVKRLWILLKHTFFGFRDDHATRLAAAISYYALFRSSR